MAQSPEGEIQPPKRHQLINTQEQLYASYDEGMTLASRTYIQEACGLDI